MPTLATRRWRRRADLHLGISCAHAFALAAFRWRGYRSHNRYVVFQTGTTLGLGAQITRVLSKAHQLRNLVEYEGHFDVDSKFLAELMSAIEQLRAGVTKLGPVRAP